MRTAHAWSRPDGSLVALAEPRPNETFISIAVQQRSIEPSDKFFEVLSAEVRLRDCDGRKVTATDTCTGVHIATELPGQAPDRLIVERATGPTLRQDFEVTPPTDTVDIEVPTNTLLAIGFPFLDGLAKSIGEDFQVARFHKHVADCPPAPTSPPAGGGGGLPVTGAPTAMAAGVGAGLLLLGGAALLIVRRRRSTFTV